MTNQQKEIVRKWIAALRSGEYTQGKSYLRQPMMANGGTVKYAYCCLGVVADLIVKGGGSTEKLAFGAADEFGTLTYDLRIWCGLRTGDGSAVVDGSKVLDLVPDASDGYQRAQKSLTGLNDHMKYDFNKIADVIEAQLKLAEEHEVSIFD